MLLRLIGRSGPERRLPGIRQLRNASTKARAIAASDFVLTEPNGNVLPTAKTTGNAFTTGVRQPIPPGATVKFSIAYVAPIAATRFELRFTPTVTGGAAVPVVFAIE